MTKRQLLQAIRDEMAMRGIDGASDHEIENALFSNVTLSDVGEAIMNKRGEKYETGDGQ